MKDLFVNTQLPVVTSDRILYTPSNFARNSLLYLQEIGSLRVHKSDVLKFLPEDKCSLVVRPSGTEPKLKIYISVSAENKEMAEEVEDEIAKTAEKWIC